MPLWDAVSARRWFMAENELRIEATGLSPAVEEALEQLGYELARYQGQDGYFARVHAVMVDPADGSLWGVSDPRDFGAAGGG
jgi:gamma-glutamyltranspeptidase